MIWEHFDAGQAGEVTVTDGYRTYGCVYEIGEVTTGRQRVFSRYFIRVTLPDGTLEIGEDQHSVRSALMNVATKLSARNLRLMAVGASLGFGETGLSWNSGWGYVDGCSKAVHMMSEAASR